MDNDPDPVAPPAADDPATPPAGAGQRRRLHVAALLNTTAVVAALAAGPLAAVVPIGAPAGAPHVGVQLIADECHAAVVFGALSTMKWPQCAGD